MTLLPATAADAVVTRDLPDVPVRPGEDIRVTITQSGFFYDTGGVLEEIPEGFRYVRGSVVDGDGYPVVIPEDSEETTDEITLDFGASENKTTLSYVVVAETAEAIENAVFSGTWKTLRSLTTEEYETGDVTGDTTLELAEEEPTPTPGNGNGGGGSNGDGAATPTPTVTTTPGGTLSPSPGATPTVSPGATGTPTVSPTTTSTATPAPMSSPTSKPLLPGFEAVLAIACLFAVAYLVIRRAN